MTYICNLIFRVNYNDIDETMNFNAHKFLFLLIHCLNQLTLIH